MIDCNDPNLNAARARKSTLFERKMTLRRTNSGFHKTLEITFIDPSMLYNLIMRGVANKTKNSFIIYDFTGKDCQFPFKGENVIKIQDYPQIVEMLLQPIENIKITELQKLLPKPKEDLFSKRMRFYNFIILNDHKNSEFYKIFESQVKSYFQENPDIKMDTILNGGFQKVNEKFFTHSINNELYERPELLESPEAKAWKMASTFHTLMKTCKIKEVQFYKADCQSFFRKYPFMSSFLENLNHSNTLIYPNEVLYGRFYYGNWKHASSEEIFKHTKITHVLNMTQEVDNYFESSPNLDVKYCKVSIEDLDGVNICTHFEKGYKFLSDALENPQNKVFVHCAQGKSRSATLVCVFFMRTYEWTFDQTIKYISDRREIACPNPGFAEQLKEFEQRGFLFDGENYCDKKVGQDAYLQIVSEFADNDNVINEQDEEGESSTSREDEYFEEGSKEAQLCNEIQIRFSTYVSSESTPAALYRSKESIENNDCISKEEQLNNINQAQLFNHQEIEIK